MAPPAYHNPIQNADILHGSKTIGLKTNNSVYDNYAVLSSSDYYIGGEIAALLANDTFRTDVRSKLGDDIQAVDIQVTDCKEVLVRKPGEDEYKLVNLTDQTAVDRDLQAIAEKTQRAFEEFQKDLPTSSSSTPGSTPSPAAKPLTGRTAPASNSELKKRVEALETKFENFQLTEALQKQKELITQAEMLLGGESLPKGIEELQTKLAKAESKIDHLEASNKELTENLTKAAALAFAIILAYQPLLQEVGAANIDEALEAIRELKASKETKEVLLGKTQALQEKLKKIDQAIPGSSLIRGTTTLERVESWSRDYGALIGELRDITHQNAELKDAQESELSSLQAELKTNKATITRLEEERDGATLKLETLTETHHRAEERHERELKQLTSKIQGLTEENHSNSEKTTRLKGELKELKKQHRKAIEELKGKLSTAEEGVRELEHELNILSIQKGGEIDRLETSAASKDERIAKLKASLAEAHQQVDGLRATLKKTNETHCAQVAELEGKIEKLTEENSSLQTEIQKLKLQITSNNKAYAEEVKGLQKQIASQGQVIEQKRGEANEEIKELKEKLEKSEAKAERLLASTRILSDEAKLHEGARSRAEKAKTEVEDRNDGLRQHLETSHEENQRQRTEIGRLSKQNATLTQEHAEAKRSLEGQLSSAKNTIEKLESKSSLSKKEHEAEEGILDAIEEEAARLEELDKEVSQYKSILKKVQEVATSKGTATNLEAELEKALGSSTPYDSLPEDLTARFEDFEAELKGLAELKKKNAKQHTKIEELENANAQAQDRTEKALKANQTLQDAKIALEIANQRIEEKNDKLRAELPQLKKELSKAQETIEDKKATHAHLLEKNRDLESSHDALKTEKGEYLKFFILANTRIDELEKEVGTKKGKIQELNKELKSVRDQLGQKEKTIQQLKDDVAKATLEAIGKYELEQRAKVLTKELKKERETLTETGKELAELKKKSAAQERALKGIQAAFNEYLPPTALEDPESYMVALNALQKRQAEQINGQESMA